MKKRVSAMEARKKFGELLEGVHYRGDEVIIERNGKVMGVVIPESRYRSIEEARETMRKLVADVHERNRGVPDEELEREIELAIREVREAKYGKKKKASAA
jgi:prevent-host-death family protein